MSSRIRNTLNVGASALIIGAAAITLAPAPAAAFRMNSFSHGGGFGQTGNSGHFGSHGLGNTSPHSTRKTGSGKTTSDKTTSDKKASDKNTSDKKTSDKNTSDKKTSDNKTDKATSDNKTSDKKTTSDETDDGTARGYIAVGLSTSDVGLSSNRAFLQWTGITAGITESFYDFYSGPAAQYGGGYFPASDTGDPSLLVWGYSAQLGIGISATMSAEQLHATQIITSEASGTANVGMLMGNGPVADYILSHPSLGNYILSGPIVPVQAADVVGNIRLDQTWGSAQIMAASDILSGSILPSAPDDIDPVTGDLGGPLDY